MTEMRGHGAPSGSVVSHGLTLVVQGQPARPAAGAGRSSRLAPCLSMVSRMGSFHCELFFIHRPPAKNSLVQVSYPSRHLGQPQKRDEAQCGEAVKLSQRFFQQAEIEMQLWP